MKEKLCILSSCLLIVLFGLSACSTKSIQEDEIDTIFAQDYVQIYETTKYLLSLEETRVYIDIEHKKVTGRFGEPIEIRSPEVKKIIDELKQKGYHEIEKKDSVVIFDLWRKSFKSEYESGFAYSADSSGDLSTIQFLIYQRALPTKEWYYYESDYNEWRTRAENGLREQS